MVVCSTWWTTLYKAALYYGFLFYMFLALLYVVLGIYRSSTNSIPGLRTISRYASAPVVFAVCSVPGVRMVDDSLYSLCAPIVTKDRPKGPRKARRIDGPRATRNTTEVLYEFAALCTPEFWEETLKLGNHLTDLSSSFSTLRTPYERLYARWKYTVSAELRARRLPAVMPLLSVVESIDAAAKGLISLESNIVSAWIRVETTIGFFREKLAIAAARTSWIPGARRKKADKVLSEYAHQCEIVIEQLTVLIKFIQSVIALFEELGKRLDNVREAILLVEEVRLRDLESQWFWIRHWRTSDLSTLRTVFGLFPSMSYSASSAEKGIAVKESYFLETLQISAITATNEQMMAELVTMLTFLERKLVTWSEFKRALLAHPTDPNGDVSGTGAAAGGGGGGRMRGREEELNMELHIRLVDQMWEQYKRSSQLAWRDLMKGRAREGGEEDGEPERVGG
ncbi:hypothetical protein BKA65DRAFT_205961 [Rhexocercosporidium sp. MPI-PUGE-AT-0058]|nr:hypothetical protein BKA65DRAFT_205961 [Rhexocercosporidium sp. MPI-PUGE-AT-0058]